MYQWTHVEHARQQLNGPNTQIDCDSKLDKVFVESSTQTEIVDLRSDEQNASKVPLPDIDSSSSKIPQPPPPPPLPPFAFQKTEKEAVPENSSTQSAAPSNNLNTSSAPNVTVLSNASSFCLPPAPPVNGIPGPPPLPLPPNGNLWFKSDSTNCYF